MRARFLHGAVFAALSSAAFAWVGLDKTVTVEIDGQLRSVSTHATTVADVLQRAGVRLDAHDTLAPSASSQVRDGSHIVIKRGRLVTVRVNDVERGVWVNAADVDQVLSEIGIDADARTYVSASRSSRIPSSGEFSLQVRMPADVLLVIDGQSRTRVTTAATVADLLKAEGILLTANQYVTPAPGSYPATGTTVVVADRRGTRVAKPHSIPFKTRKIVNPTLAAGTVRVTAPGVSGVLVRYFRTRLIGTSLPIMEPDGQRIARAPLDRVIVVGTKRIAAHPAPPSGKDLIPAKPATARKPAVVVRKPAVTKTTAQPAAGKTAATPKAANTTTGTTATTKATTTVKPHEHTTTATAPSRTTTTVAAPTVKPAPTTELAAPVAAPVNKPAADTLNWYALAMCESGNNPRALSPGGTYRGLYQFHISTWRGVGGVGDPINASRDEQTYRAQILYRRVGAGAWGSCASRLFRAR